MYVLQRSVETSRMDANLPLDRLAEAIIWAYILESWQAMIVLEQSKLPEHQTTIFLESGEVRVVFKP